MILGKIPLDPSIARSCDEGTSFLSGIFLSLCVAVNNFLSFSLNTCNTCNLVLFYSFFLYIILISF